MRLMTSIEIIEHILYNYNRYNRNINLLFNGAEIITKQEETHSRRSPTERGSRSRSIPGMANAPAGIARKRNIGKEALKNENEYPVDKRVSHRCAI